MKFVVLATICALASANDWVEQSYFAESGCSGSTFRKLTAKVGECVKDAEKSGVYYKFSCSSSGAVTRQQYSTSACTGGSPSQSIGTSCTTLSSEYLKAKCMSSAPTAATGTGSGNVDKYSSATCTGTATSTSQTFSDSCTTEGTGSKTVGCGSSGMDSKIETAMYKAAGCMSSDLVSVDTHMLSTTSCTKTGSSESKKLSSYMCSPAVGAVPAAVTALFAVVLAAFRN